MNSEKSFLDKAFTAASEIKPIIKVLSSVRRQKILKKIEENGRMTVKDVANKMKMYDSQASKELGIMFKVGLITKDDVGVNTYVALNRPKIALIHTFLAEIKNIKSE